MTEPSESDSFGVILMRGRASMLDEIEAAECLWVAPKTLRNWRSLRMGPAYLKLGRRVRYRRADLIAYVDALAVTRSEQLPE